MRVLTGLVLLTLILQGCTFPKKVCVTELISKVFRCSGPAEGYSSSIPLQCRVETDKGDRLTIKRLLVAKGDRVRICQWDKHGGGQVWAEMVE